MAANTSMFNALDVVTMYIPECYDSEGLYKRLVLSKSERYVISDVLFAAYSRDDNFIYWEYELKDHANLRIPEDWLRKYEDEEEIYASDIECLMGD